MGMDERDACNDGAPCRYLGPEGQVVAPLPPEFSGRDPLVALYRAMTLTRTFDAKVIALQRTGQVGTYASTLGQEAIGVGLGSAMRDDDLLLPSYRDTAAQILRGVTLSELLLYWGGDERGSDFSGPREDFPICVPVGTQYCHAVGVATAFRLRKQPRVAVVTGGDGSTSKGDFYEALNLAGAWSLPVVFVINNNRWAISVPLTRQSGTVVLADKARAGGFPGVRVDGNDAVAVCAVVGEALERARRGDGPTLVEALSYRLGDHTTADDAGRYRDPEEVSRHWAEEPLVRMRNHLVAEHGWDKQDEERLLDDCASEVEQAVATFQVLLPDPPEAMFDHLHATLPAAYREQRADLARGLRK
jgi:pyruvate dehydrogenase E1 component alpha subunit